MAKRRIVGEDGRVYVEKKRGGCLKLGLIGIGSLILIGAFGSDDNQNKTDENPTTVVVENTTTIQTTELEETETSTEDMATSEITEPAQTETLENKFDEEANQKFATQLMKFINGVLQADGITEQIRVTYYSYNVINVILPQDYKYVSNAEIQQISDAILNIKNAQYSEFALENNYPADQGPTLFVETEDGTLLAEESAWSGAMKRKYEN